MSGASVEIVRVCFAFVQVTDDLESSASSADRAAAVLRPSHLSLPQLSAAAVAAKLAAKQPKRVCPECWDMAKPFVAYVLPLVLAIGAWLILDQRHPLKR